MKKCSRCRKERQSLIYVYGLTNPRKDFRGEMVSHMHKFLVCVDCIRGNDMIIDTRCEKCKEKCIFYSHAGCLLFYDLHPKLFIR